MKELIAYFLWSLLATFILFEAWLAIVLAFTWR